MDLKLERLDVVTFMVFINYVEKIRIKLNVYVDVAWNSLMIIEEETRKNSFEGNLSGDESYARDSKTGSVSSEGSKRKVFEEEIGATTDDLIS